MSLNFPPSANTGDIYTSGNASYEFTGTKWKPVNRVDYTIQASDIVATNNELVIDFDTDGIQRLTLSEEATVIFANPPAEGEMKKVLLDLTANTDPSYEMFQTLSVDGFIYDNVTGDVETGSGGTTHILWGKDGYRLYGMDFENDVKGFHQYNLTIPYDLSSMSYVTSKFIYSSGSYTRGSYIKPDGSMFYLLTNGVIATYPAVTNWEITNWGSPTYITIPGGSLVFRIRFGDNANKLYTIVKGTTSYLREYILPNPWDISAFTGSTVQNYQATLAFSATDFFISGTGDKIWIVDASTDTIKEYSMSNWDLSTIQYTGYQLSVGSRTTDPFSIELANNKMYLCTGDVSATSVVYQYSASYSIFESSLIWPETIEWEDGTTPTLPALTETALIELEARTDYLGTNYIGRLVGRNF